MCYLEQYILSIHSEFLLWRLRFNVHKCSLHPPIYSVHKRTQFHFHFQRCLKCHNSAKNVWKMFLCGWIRKVIVLMLTRFRLSTDSGGGGDRSQRGNLIAFRDRWLWTREIISIKSGIHPHRWSLCGDRAPVPDTCIMSESDSQLIKAARPFIDQHFRFVLYLARSLNS